MADGNDPVYDSFDDPYVTGASYNPSYTPATEGAATQSTSENTVPYTGYPSAQSTAPGGTAGAYAPTPGYVAQTPPPSPYDTAYTPGYGASTQRNPGTKSLAMGILSIIFPALAGLVLGIIAVVTGSSTLRTHPDNGSAKGGRVCGIIGIALSALTMLSTCAMLPLAAELSEYNTYTDGRHSFDYYDEFDDFDDFDDLWDDFDDRLFGDSWPDELSGGLGGQLGQSDEDDARQAAVQVLDSIAHMTAEQKRNLANALDDELNDPDDGMTLNQLGISSIELAEWLVSDFSYETRDLFAYDNHSGFLIADVTSRDFPSLMDKFRQTAADYAASDEFTNSENRDAALQHMGQLMREAMEQTPATEKTVYVDVEKQGSWKVDSDALEAVYYEAFGVDL